MYYSKDIKKLQDKIYLLTRKSIFAAQPHLKFRAKVLNKKKCAKILPLLPQGSEFSVLFSGKKSTKSALRAYAHT